MLKVDNYLKKSELLTTFKAFHYSPKPCSMSVKYARNRNIIFNLKDMYTCNWHSECTGMNTVSRAFVQKHMIKLYSLTNTDVILVMRQQRWKRNVWFGNSFMNWKKNLKIVFIHIRINLINNKTGKGFDSNINENFVWALVYTNLF